MSWFCPSCGNMLLLQINIQGIQEFYCQTCPYVFPIIRPVNKYFNKDIYIYKMIK